jgi:hypothetical protein
MPVTGSLSTADTSKEPQAAAAFQAVRAWRGWSEVNPAIHYAFYEFPDLSASQVILESDALSREVVAAR